MIHTGEPTRTCVNSHSASGMRMRMHPWEALYPMDVASGVPCRPTPGEEIPIQRVPSGLPGPGGTGFSPAAQAESGGYHQGLACFVTISKRPTGVGYCDWPTATPSMRSLAAFFEY